MYPVRDTQFSKHLDKYSTDSGIIGTSTRDVHPLKHQSIVVTLFGIIGAYIRDTQSLKQLSKSSTLYDKMGGLIKEVHPSKHEFILVTLFGITGGFTNKEQP